MSRADCNPHSADIQSSESEEGYANPTSVRLPVNRVMPGLASAAIATKEREEKSNNVRPGEKRLPCFDI